MNLALTSLSILICTSISLCGTMILCWLYFGRHPYALIWAISAGGTALQWTLNAIGQATGVNQPLLLILTGTLVAINSTLVPLGARSRMKLPLRLPLFIGCTLLAIAAIVISLLVFHNLALRGFIANAFGAVMIATAAGSLVPRDRTVTLPEIVVICVFLLFALLEMGLALLSLGMGANGSAAGGDLYRTVLMVTMPSVYAALGISAVFLLAMDLNRQLQALVSRDPLTGVLNRRGIQQGAVAALAIARRHERPLSVVVCDIDGFKAFNLSRGFALGDRVLRGLADTMLANVREEDLLGRIDGDGFMLILIDSSAMDAAVVVERMRSAFEALRVDGFAPGLTATFGIADFRAEDVSVGDIAARADEALQQARAAGRNCAVRV